MKKITILLFLIALGLNAQSPAQSMYFNRNLKSNLKMAKSDFGQLDRRTLSGVVWYKRYQTGVHSQNWALGNGSNTNPEISFRCDFNPSNRLTLMIFRNGLRDYYGKIESLPIYTDKTGWHRIQWAIDLNNPVASDRIRIYHDGSRITTFNYAKYPNGLYDLAEFNHPISLGGDSPAGNTGSATSYFPGKMCMAAIFSGRIPYDSELAWQDGSPKDFGSSPNLKCLIRGDAFPLTDDEILTANWTNSNVDYSDDVP